MKSQKKYLSPISFEDIEQQDEKITSQQKIRYEKEIKHFQYTAELYISLFSNSKRQHRDTLKSDYIQLVAIRIFQDSRSALILALKGLYPQAASLIRGVLESINLIYDFIINPDDEDLWFDAGKKKREDLFKASNVRRRVEESGKFNIEASKAIYNLLSDYSVHTNMESHLWYIETGKKSIYYHWAGYDADKRSDVLILSIMNALAQGLFVLTYEDIYAHNQYWVEDFNTWKKNHLIFMQKFAKAFDIEGYEDLVVKTDKVVLV